MTQDHKSMETSDWASRETKVSIKTMVPLSSWVLSASLESCGCGFLLNEGKRKCPHFQCWCLSLVALPPWHHRVKGSQIWQSKTQSNWDSGNWDSGKSAVSSGASHCCFVPWIFTSAGSFPSIYKHSQTAEVWKQKPPSFRSYSNSRL